MHHCTAIDLKRFLCYTPAVRGIGGQLNWNSLRVRSLLSEDMLYCVSPTVTCVVILIVQRVRKKWTQNVVISPIKLGRFWWNLVYRFLNKFAAKSCKQFPPHLNNISTLPCATCSARRGRFTIKLLQKETPDFIPPQLWPPISSDLAENWYKNRPTAYLVTVNVTAI